MAVLWYSWWSFTNKVEVMTGLTSLVNTLMLMRRSDAGSLWGTSGHAQRLPGDAYFTILLSDGKAVLCPKVPVLLVPDLSRVTWADPAVHYKHDTPRIIWTLVGGPLVNSSSSITGVRCFVPSLKFVCLVLRAVSVILYLTRHTANIVLWRTECFFGKTEYLISETFYLLRPYF